MVWHEIPLIIFTVLAQTAVGAFLLMGLVLVLSKVGITEQSSINKSMFFIWVLMGVGFTASTMHLGSPLRAINALNQVGSSWLSNEIFTGCLFFAAGGCYWLLEMLDSGSEALRRGLMIVAMLIGVIFMYAMIKVYLIDTVPTWNSVYTPIGFMLTTVISGGLFGHMLLTGAGYSSERVNNLLPLLGAVAVVISILSTVSQVSSLSGLSSAIVSASDLVPAMEALQLAHIALLIGALAVWLLPRFTAKKPALPQMVLGVALVFAAELISRGVFYSLHMTVGM